MNRNEAKSISKNTIDPENGKKEKQLVSKFTFLPLRLGFVSTAQQTFFKHCK